MRKHDRIIGMKSYTMPAQQYHSFLEHVKNGWYVETQPSTDGVIQSGTVIGIICDKFGIPACLKVQSGDNLADHIPVDRVSFFEAEDYFDADDYLDFDETREWVLNQGYVFDEENCTYRHPDTGEEICW